ncbi:MAG TPA: hypothetical protein VMM78_11120 [Thermomicrobiales bacterium]|nr:hypothetical protein [Thermomicrobiales bacterium]
MRAFLAVIGVSFAVGAAGAWTLADALSQYTSTLRTFTELEIDYQPGSFVWLDPEFSHGRATVVFNNGSPSNARIDNINLNLLFDGEFAGANYDGTDGFTLARGEARAVEVEFRVTTLSIQHRGGSSTLGLSGSVVVEFSGIERELALRVRRTIGPVATVEEP